MQKKLFQISKLLILRFKFFITKTVRNVSVLPGSAAQSTAGGGGGDFEGATNQRRGRNW